MKRLIPLAALTTVIGVGGAVLTGAKSAGQVAALDAATKTASSGVCTVDNNEQRDHMMPNNTVTSMIDDFTVTFFVGCSYETLVVRGTWDTMEPGAGTGALVQILEDDNGTPGAVVVTASVLGTSEVPTGNTYLGRPESEVTISMSPVVLLPGDYWVKYRVNGPEPFFYSLGCSGGVQGSFAWVTTNFYLSPAPISFVGVTPCDAVSDASWRLE